MFKLIKIIGLIFLLKINILLLCDDHLSSLRIIYMAPQDEDTIFNLNEKSTFGNNYINGWILPSTEKLTLNFYLYYDGDEVQRLNQIYYLFHKLNSTTSSLNNNKISGTGGDDGLSDDTQQNQTKNQKQVVATSVHIRETLYMYFTTESDCNDYHTEQHIPLKFLSKLADNMYKVQISVRLNYAKKPYYICMQQIDSDENIYDQNRHFHHQGTDYWLSIITTTDMIPLWSRIVIFFFLLTLSGLFSGLNLGLMSLDVSELDILKRIGTPNERLYAKQIYPLRKRGNFLLCTILLGNVLVNATSTLILGDILSGIYAAFGSTILIVLFGEIIPQAACSKHGLAVGARTRFIMIIFMILTSPVSFPLSKILDFVLGKEITATYNREKIRELMKNVKDLEEKELIMISGALDFNKRIVGDIMTPLNDVFMLDINSKLDFATIVNIQQKGFSRIPVYDTTKDNVVGLLHVKDFTLLDPDDNMPVKALLDHYNHKVTYCYKDDKLDNMFEKFRLGETHLAFVIETVQDEDQDPYQKCVGIITLEDIIEELVQLEIYDEFDDKQEIEKDLRMHLNKKKNFNGSTTTIDSNESKERSKSTSRKQSRSDSRRASKNASNLNLGGCVGGGMTESTNSINIKVDEKIQKQISQIKTELSGNNLNNSTKETSFIRGNSTNSHHAPPPKYEAQTSLDLSFFLQQQAATQIKLISPQLSLALFQFLSSSVKPFTSEFLTKNVLELIFRRDLFKESRRAQDKSPPEYLYQYGKKCNYFIIILTGEATLEVGLEKLEFIAGQFAYFGVNALLNENDTVEQVLQDPHITKTNYIPDFSLRVDDKCVYFKIDRDLWFNGVKKSKFQMENSDMSHNIDLNCNLTSVQTSNTQSTDYSNVNTSQDHKDVNILSQGLESKSTLSLDSKLNNNNKNFSVDDNNLDSEHLISTKLSNEKLNDKKMNSNNNKLAFVKENDKKINKSSEYIELIKYKEEHDD